ncbi:hypothetical protein JI666_09280 [Bacillus sp. NTK071]|uniref:hypothetical protein n=1 Tax=Bacillus sp. NTK071 TaxID=2802175 RepID=UPI001A8EE688|nr:hypothetical protein [Bacillus sp. NTK071]MBN8208936.1 hypothetical protein [Bacillus sp. NTK071]
MKNLVDYEAVEISRLTYKDDLKSIPININGERVTWYPIDTIIDEETGLQGYVLQKLHSNEIVISFRGTEMPTSVTTEVKSKYVGSPSQDAMLASGEASIENGNLVYEKGESWGRFS